MSTVTLPAAFIPSQFNLNLVTNQRVIADPYGGSEQSIDFLNDRWMCSAELSANVVGDGAWVEAFIGSMRGQTNTVNLYHFARKAPRGTVRGTLTLNAAVAQGAASIVVTGCSPATGTLKAGDLLGVGGLLLMVSSDCTAVAGVITVPLVNRVRKALSSGAAVTWDKPTAPFRLLASSGTSYTPGQHGATSFDFGEAIA